MHKSSGQPRRFGFPENVGLGEPSQDTLPLHDRVAAKILAWQAAAAPERPFVHYQDRWFTYGEVDRRANRTANALAAAGVKKGDRVAILLRNRVEYLDVWFALARLGAIHVPINVDYKATQIAHTFTRSKITCVVVEDGLLTELVQTFAVTGTSLPVVLLDAQASASVPHALSYAEMVASASETAPEGSWEVSGADVGTVMNTSGTTGPSKGVLMPHAQQYILGRMIAADMQLTADDVYYNFYPMFHNTAQAMIVIPVLLVGARMVLVEKFSASKFWTDIHQHGCTAFYYIGEIVRILLKTSTSDDAKGSSLRVAWGIGASAADFVEFSERFNVQLRAGYGSTEANVPCYMPHDSAKPGSAGRVAPGFQVRIADELGQELPTNAVGEILVRSTEPCALMAGYDGDPEATVRSWKDLWFHTGDAGYFDEDGDLFFSGRIKDAIRVKGENVSAFEVEAVILENPAVLEVAAIAVPGELGGDDLKVVVVLRPGASLEPEDLIELAKERLPNFAVPRYVEFVTSLPKTPTNKVKKHELREVPFSSGTWDRLAKR